MCTCLIILGVIGIFPSFNILQTFWSVNVICHDYLVHCLLGADKKPKYWGVFVLWFIVSLHILSDLIFSMTFIVQFILK